MRVFRIDTTHQLAHCMDCDRKKTKCVHAKAALNGSNHSEVKQDEEKDVEGDEDEEEQDDVAEILPEVEHNETDCVSIPLDSFRHPSPLTLRDTGLHWPMCRGDDRYPPPRKEVAMRILSPFLSFVAQQYTANSIPAPLQRIRLDSVCMQCRNQNVPPSPPSSALSDQRQCWILGDTLIFPAVYDCSLCPIHQCSTVVDGYEECVIQASGKFLFSELFLDGFFDYYREDGQPSFHVFTKLAVCQYMRNKNSMPWIGLPKDVIDLLNKLAPQLRALFEKVCYLLRQFLLSASQWLLCMAWQAFFRYIHAAGEPLLKMMARSHVCSDRGDCAIQFDGTAHSLNKSFADSLDDIVQRDTQPAKSSIEFHDRSFLSWAGSKSIRTLVVRYCLPLEPSPAYH
jgi:hypothetical protein